jgi:hypothetical protein
MICVNVMAYLTSLVQLLYVIKPQHNRSRQYEHVSVDSYANTYAALVRTHCAYALQITTYRCMLSSRNDSMVCSTLYTVVHHTDHMHDVHTVSVSISIGTHLAVFC